MLGVDWVELRDENGNTIWSDEAGYSPVSLTELDPGAPTVRAVSNDFPNRSGALDTSRFFGARAVSLTFHCADETPRRHFMSTMMPLIDPARRPSLVVYIPEWGEDPWSMQIRADSFTAPLTIGSDINLTWQAHTGVWESADTFQVTMFPTGDNTGGMTFGTGSGMTFGSGSGMTFGAGDSPSAKLVQVGGDFQTPPDIKIYGPITAPSILLQNTEQEITFASDYTIAAGDYVDINVEAGTVLLNGQTTSSQFGHINWSVTDLWQLRPGDNTVALTGSSMSAVTQATISWRTRRA